MSDPRGFPPINGILNFDQVTKQLFRGAQPNRLGLVYLKSLGMTDIVNLRAADDCWPAENRLTLDLGMNYANVQMSGISTPSDAEVGIIMDYLKAALNEVPFKERKVFVHCEHGCDRTGTIIACARIRFEGWTNDLALKEADIYGMSGLELGMRHFISEFK